MNLRKLMRRRVFFAAAVFGCFSLFAGGFPYGVSDLVVRHETSAAEVDSTETPVEVPAVNGGMPATDPVATLSAEVVGFRASDEEGWRELTNAIGTVQTALAIRRSDGACSWMGYSDGRWIPLQSAECAPEEGEWAVKVDVDYAVVPAAVRYSVRRPEDRAFAVLTDGCRDWLPIGTADGERVGGVLLYGFGETGLVQLKSGAPQVEPEWTVDPSRGLFETELEAEDEAAARVVAKAAIAVPPSVGSVPEAMKAYRDCFKVVSVKPVGGTVGRYGVVLALDETKVRVDALTKDLADRLDEIAAAFATGRISGPIAIPAAKLKSGLWYSIVSCAKPGFGGGTQEGVRREARGGPIELAAEKPVGTDRSCFFRAAVNATRLREKSGRLLLTFDDKASLGSWLAARETFRRFDARATFFVDGTYDQETLAAMKTLAADGHSLGFHGSLAGQKVTDLLDSLGAEELIAREIAPEREAARTAGLSMDCFAYPSSARNAATDAILLGVVSRLRSGQLFARNPATEPLKDQGSAFLSAEETKTAKVIVASCIISKSDLCCSEIGAALERAAANDETIALYSHAIEPTGAVAADTHNVTLPQLEKILEKAHLLNMSIIGFDELP